MKVSNPVEHFAVVDVLGFFDEFIQEAFLILRFEFSAQFQIESVGAVEGNFENGSNLFLGGASGLEIIQKLASLEV